MAVHDHSNGSVIVCAIIGGYADTFDARYQCRTDHFVGAAITASAINIEDIYVY
jgi:hypothetical protein